MIIEYLVGTKDLGLKFERESGLNLLVFADANYAEKADDRRRSVSGVAVTLGNSVVSWVSSTQEIVTLSTTEAEYVALGDGVKEALFAKAGVIFHRSVFVGELHRGVRRQRRRNRSRQQSA